MRRIHVALMWEPACLAFAWGNQGWWTVGAAVFGFGLQLVLIECLARAVKS